MKLIARACLFYHIVKNDSVCYFTTTKKNDICVRSDENTKGLKQYVNVHFAASVVGISGPTQLHET